MLRLLRANFRRLVKDPIFYLVAIVSFVYSMAVTIGAYIGVKYQNGNASVDMLLTYNYGFGGFIPVPGILMAVFCGFFVGRDYNDGTIRNKLVVGHARTNIYLSNLIVCSAVAITLNIIYALPVFALGMPLLGTKIAMAPATLAWVIGNGTLMMISYAALFTLSSMIIRSMTVSLVVNILAVVVLMFAFMILINKLNEPDMIESLVIINGEEVYELVPNPDKLSGWLKQFVQILVDIFPTGQSLQITRGESFNTWQMLVSSAGMITAATTAGLLVFRRLDLK